MAHAEHPTKAVHHFRCLDGSHTLEELRDPNGPLVLRQSAWCTTHDCPAVGVGDAVRSTGHARRGTRPA